MPKPLTISEAARRLARTRVTVRKRMKSLGIVAVGGLTQGQFKRLKRSFSTTPKLPQGALK